MLSGGGTVRRHALCEELDRCLRAAAAMRNAERAKPHLDHAERAEDHRRIDVPHVRDAEALAFALPERAAKRDAAFLAAIVDERLCALAVSRDHRRDGIAALLRLGDVER